METERPRTEIEINLSQSNHNSELNSMVSSAEEQHLHQLAQSNDLETFHDAYPSCSSLPDFFLRTAARLPHTVALQFDRLSISYRQLLHLSQFLALRIEGKRGRTIPICVDKSIEMIVTMLAVTLSGSSFLNLEPKFPNARKEGILIELKEKGLLNTTAVVQSGEMEEWNRWNLVETILNPSEILKPLLDSLYSDSSADLVIQFPISEHSLAIALPSDPAYLIFTSGSSGAPKGIIIDHLNVASFLRNYHGVFGRAVGERILQFPSYSFDVSVMNIFDTFAVRTLRPD